MSEPIKTFTDEENGVRVFVVAVPKGFSVSVQDVDSGEFLPTTRIYPTVEQAITYAEKCVR